MSVYKMDEIAAIRVNERIVCSECFDDFSNVAEDDIITQDDIDRSDEIWFCDECKKRI